MQLRLRKYATSSKDKMKGTKHKEYGMKFLWELVKKKQQQQQTNKQTWKHSFDERNLRQVKSGSPLFLSFKFCFIMLRFRIIDLKSQLFA